MVVKLVRLSAGLLLTGKGERESSHQEGTVGGEVPSLVLKVCIKGARSLAPHTHTEVHAWVFSFEEEVNEQRGGLLARPL